MRNAIQQSYADAVPALEHAKSYVWVCPRCDSAYDHGGECPACRAEWEGMEPESAPEPPPTDEEMEAMYEAHVTDLAAKYLGTMPLRRLTRDALYATCLCRALVHADYHTAHARVCQLLRQAAVAK